MSVDFGTALASEYASFALQVVDGCGRFGKMSDVEAVISSSAMVVVVSVGCGRGY